MAVHYRFKSSTVSESISIDGSFVGVGELKALITEKKFGKDGGTRRKRNDLILQNASTMEEYMDEFALIPRNTSVVVSCVPLQRQLPIIVGGGGSNIPEPSSIEKEESCFNPNNGLYDFGDDPLSIGQVVKPIVQSDGSKSKSSCDMPESDKIKSMNKSTSSELNFKLQGSFTASQSYFGSRTIIPQGYVCHRCNVAGHLIQHCPTNGDPRYDKRRMLQPSEAASDKQVEAISSSSSSRKSVELPPELHCPLCKQVMRDAVFTSKCCFSTFCEECIRSLLISKSMCACGKTHILADHLLPNMTVRETISRLLAPNSSSSEKSESVSQTQNTKSSHCDQSKTQPSPKKDTADLEETENAKKTGAGKAEDVVESSLLHVKEVDTQKLPVAVNVTEQQGRITQSSYSAMPYGHSQYSPYWSSSFSYGTTMPHMGSGPSQGYSIHTVPIKRKCEFVREAEHDKNGKLDIQPRKNANDAAVKSNTGVLFAERNSSVTGGHRKLPREMIPCRNSKSRTYYCGKERVTEVEYKQKQHPSSHVRIQETNCYRRPPGDAKPIKYREYREDQRYCKNKSCRASIPDKRKAPSSVHIIETSVMLMESDSSDDEDEKYFKRRRRRRYEPEDFVSLVA